MSEIVDYYKNSKYYQSELSGLIPLKEFDYQSDMYLHQLVQKFDELTFGRKGTLDNIATNIDHTESSLTYDLDDELSIVFYHDYGQNFTIELFLGDKYSMDGNVIFVRHIFTEEKNIIEIERDRLKGFPNIPSVNLVNMKIGHINEELSEEELNNNITSLEMVNKSLESLYNKSSRTLRKKKEE